MKVRVAEHDDLETLVQGNLAMARETESVELDPETVREGVEAVLAARVPGRYYVLENDAGEVVAQLLITREWSDWRARDVWWIQSVWVPLEQRRRGAFRRLYAHVRTVAVREEAAGLRLYVDRRNTPAQEVYRALGMNGDHYRVFEDMFDEPPASDKNAST